jgi:hypothetical protein
MKVNTKDGTAAVAVGDVLISLWLAPANVPLWHWHFAQVEETARRSPEGVLYLDLILPSSNPPDAALRAIMQADLRRFGPQLRKLIAVPLGDGMWISIVRAIVRGTLLVSGHAKRAAVVATVAEGITLACELASPATPTAQALRGAVTELFQALGIKQSTA